jgi:xylulokinase
MAPDHLLLTGGGTKSPFLRRMLSEVLGVPVAGVNKEEGPSYGAALLAGVGVGAWPDVAAAARATLSRGALEVPDAEACAAYDALFQRFRSSYPAAKLPA